MKKLLCLVISMSLLVHAQSQKGLQFEEGLNWEQVKARAKAANKYIFLDIYATWCGPCKQMDKEVYPNDTVGNYMNDKFISVKVQMDVTSRDNEHVKNWYADARKINAAYSIEGYPSFLFFTPGATLIYKEAALKNVPDFIKMVDKALNPQNILYYSRLEDYKKGKKSDEELRELAIYAKSLGERQLAKQIAEDYISKLDKKELLTRDNILLMLNIAGNKKMADSLAKEYKGQFLDHLSNEALCNKENVDFILRFQDLISSKDNFFKLCYYHPEQAGRFMDSFWVNDIVSRVITREEMDGKLLKDRKPVSKKEPDWDKIQSTISKKYEKADAHKLVLDYQVAYYGYYDKNWPQWAKYFDLKIKTYPVEPSRAFFDLNMPAWTAFKHCNDPKVLAKALEWSELSIALEKSNPNFQCLDTRANLLYKLGRVQEAIAQEEEAVEVALVLSKQEGWDVQGCINAAIEYKEIIKKMRKGEPTYLEEGAVWDANTLPKGK